VLIVVSLFLAGNAGAAPTPFLSPLPPPVPRPPLPDVQPIAGYVAAVGIGAIITLLVQILKAFGLVADGQAGKWATAANVVVFAGLWVAGAFGFDVTDSAVQNVLTILEQLGKLILMVVTSPVFFQVLCSAQVVNPRR
jgi:hypothetical protein